MKEKYPIKREKKNKGGRCRTIYQPLKQLNEDFNKFFQKRLPLRGRTTKPKHESVLAGRRPLVTDFLLLNEVKTTVMLYCMHLLKLTGVHNEYLQ